ncbi:helix-turn-helix domain-containing protein [Sandarakinorhabdus sp.]|uniref:helix-turn-helix domain-containing protein n=1 Tax=Sandarakinorhabdus sp. TaxID=1916663 RepID=UPI003340B278
MTKTAFDKIAAGLKDAIAYAAGDASRGRIALPLDVKAVRLAANKTQTQFASAYHIPVATLRDWEQGRRQPDAPARALLTVIAADPLAVEKMLASG